MARTVRLTTDEKTLQTRVDYRPQETPDAAVDRARERLGVPADELVSGEVMSVD